MIKKLKRRFVMVSMLAVVIVLLLIMVSVNAANYMSMTDSADRLLELIEENGGSFPRMEGGFHGAPGQINGGFTPESPFETRYFTVSFGADGEVSAVNTGSIAAVARDKAVEYAGEIYKNGRDKGYVDVYRYRVSENENGATVTFVDRARELRSFYVLLKSSAAVCLAAALGVFLLLIISSGRAIKPIADSYEKQKRFITDASHELKTPLTVIDANTEVLEMTVSENQWTRSIHNQVAKLTELTGNLVALTRLDEGGNMLMTDFSLSDAVEESVNAFITPAQQQGKTIEMELRRNMTLEGNEEAIRRLVGILMDNALKYSDGGSIIKVQLKAGGKGAVLQIKNATAGIEKGDHSELFDRFYRGDQSRNSEKGGYGIGLSMAKSIVSAHKGRIMAKSENGNTLTVTVNL